MYRARRGAHEGLTARRRGQLGQGPVQLTWFDLLAQPSTLESGVADEQHRERSRGPAILYMRACRPATGGCFQMPVREDMRSANGPVSPHGRDVPGGHGPRRLRCLNARMVDDTSSSRCDRGVDPRLIRGGPTVEMRAERPPPVPGGAVPQYRNSSWA